MKARIALCLLALGGVLFPLGLEAAQGVKAPYNPKPFQNFVASPSAQIRFLLSEKGKQLLQRSPSPVAQTLLKAAGESPTGGTTTPSLSPVNPNAGGHPSDPGSLSAICPATVGCTFNLEPSTSFFPQNEESLDFLLAAAAGNDLVVEGANDFRGLFGGFAGVTGYYVSRDADGTPEFEGALPVLPDPLASGKTLAGQGDPTVAADPPRSAIFMADSRLDDSTTAVGVFRTTSANLQNTTNCPNGTHTAAQAATCWPTHTVVNPLPDPFNSYLQDSPHLTVDERASGVGAGDVYITATEFDFHFSHSRIWLVACKNALTSCSAPVLISGGDTATQNSYPAVRPDGGITITYVNAVGFPQQFRIKYVRCTPAGAPATPSCQPAVLVYNETKPLPFGFGIGTELPLGVVGGNPTLGAEQFVISTYPKHDHRVDANGTETYVVWDRCKVAPIAFDVCPDADVVMTASKNNGATWSAPVNVVAGDHNDQFFPAIKTDRSRNIVNITYYSSQNDLTFQHRVQVFLNHINPGAATPDPINDTHVITSLLDDPSSDPYVGGGFFGDYIGVAARGNGTDGKSHAYVGFTYNDVSKVCNGVACPQQDNKLQRLDY